MNRLDPDDAVMLYKIVLFDEWYELDEQARRDYIRRMMFAKYGAYKDSDLFAVMNKVEETDIYKWAQNEGMLES